jgi:putative photosynthetic complex assembly protein 2
VLSYGLPVAATLLIWWFSTGAILFLNGLPRGTFAWSMAGASLIGAGALYGIWISSGETSTGAAYGACLSALMIWGWNETAFLLGYITGSRRTPCPENAKSFQRFIYATQSIIYHELSILVSAGAIVLASWGGANQFGLWTFLVLWIMRLSTKVNIFLGVPNVTIEFLPAHLTYLKSYFRIKPMNLLFPVSITVSTVVVTMLVVKTLEFAADSHAGIGFTLLTTLMVLAVIEHWFLVIPLAFGEIWSWGLKSRKPPPSNVSLHPTRSTIESISSSVDLTATPASNLSTIGALLKSEPSKELPKMWSNSVSSTGSNR